MGCVSTRKLHFRMEKMAWSFIFLGANTKAPSSDFLHAHSPSVRITGVNYFIFQFASQVFREAARYSLHCMPRIRRFTARPPLPDTFFSPTLHDPHPFAKIACNRGPRSDTLGRSISGVKITFFSRIVHVVCQGNVRERRDSRNSWFSSWSRAGASGSACDACYGGAWSPGPGCAADSAWSAPECRLGARPRDGPGLTRSRWTCNHSCSPDGGQLSAGTVEFVRYTSN